MPAGRQDILHGRPSGLFQCLWAQTGHYLACALPFIEWLVFNIRDSVRDFDVLDPLDLLAFLDEANRYRVPEFRYELSAFHVPYLRVYDVCLAAE